MPDHLCIVWRLIHRSWADSRAGSLYRCARAESDGCDASSRRFCAPTSVLRWWLTGSLPISLPASEGV